MSVEPLTKKYPELTPYQFASNRPTQCIDQDGLEAFFNNSGQFVKYGTDASNTAPVIFLVNNQQLETGLTIEQFKTRVYMLTGEGASGDVSAYYAHTFKNAKEFGYHGKGFTEEKTLDVLWNDGKYGHDDYMKGIPNSVKGYQSYKDAFPLMNTPSKWNDRMNHNANAILEAETGLSPDPTRGATNWGGGSKNYDFYVEQFGASNVITIKENGGQHNFFNLNTGVLNSPTSPPVDNDLQGAPKKSGYTPCPGIIPTN